ncbi:MAG: histidine kinase [Flavobacteriales bacterium]|nr:histidine kinase [Flavobacteriales bacterium]
MNPHFIFNALTSINSYVQESERELASGFLTKFARLMRLVLENSRHNEVPLVQDLEALRLYMELEQSRMNGKFEFTIEVDSSIDQETALVPPLVMQPFVENAIWHGISRKEEKGHIRLTVSKDGKRLMMTVEDDGVGRQPRAGTAPSDGSSPKTSWERPSRRTGLRSWASNATVTRGFRYVDVPMGTRVEMTIPSN